jgi:hypothetical protein
VPAHKPRHAKPSKAAPALAVGGMTATLGTLTGGTANAASSDDFARLRQCESGGNYAISTGNGFYGAYQFDRRTWQGLGYPGTANQADPATQDEGATRLQAARGWQPWPSCSRKLGLGSDREVRASRSSFRSVLVKRAARPAVLPIAAPAFAGTVLSTDLVKQNRGDVRRWQHRMHARGWDIAVDGHFGPQSAHLAARFAAEKGLRVAPGTVDAALWNAAWELPVA